MMTFEERLWAKVDRRGPDECWPWTGARKSDGYGHIAVNGHHKLAHRATYELLVGPIPDGLVIDHLCRVPHCVNPGHMEPVTLGENSRRGVGIKHAAEIRRARTHCKRGHEFTPENTYINSRGCRVCRTCQRMHGRAHDLKRRNNTHQPKEAA